MALDAYNPSAFSCLTPPHKTGTEGLCLCVKGLQRSIKMKKKKKEASLPGFSHSKLMQIN